MVEAPEDLKYSESEEWVRVDGDVATVGLTDWAQNELTDVVYVELPAVGDTVEKGKAFAVVESVKAAADTYAPVSGEVVKINERLEGEPELINNSPFTDGWMIAIKLSNLDEINMLKDIDAYKEQLASKE